MSHHYSGDHKCDLEKKSTSCLPKPSPRASIFSRIIRFISKGRLPTYYNRRTQEYFKSEKSLIDERLRILSDAPWYVIHPFSIISLIRDFIMFHTFIIDLITSNLLSSFRLKRDTPMTYEVMLMFNGMCSFIYVINCLMCLTMGFVVEDSLSIELRPRKIIARYLRSYAVVDFMLIVPTESWFRGTQAAALSKTSFVASWLRFKSYLPHFAMTLKVLYKVPDTYVDISICALVILLLQHCTTCYSASLWKIVPKEIHDRRNGTTLYRLFVESDKYNWMEIYFNHYHIVLCHFFYAGRGRHGIYTNEECIFYAGIMVLAFFMGLYVATLAWALVKQANRSQIRYEHVMQQINDFANRKGLNQRLRFRLVAHIQQKYRGNVFNEQAFYSSLSEHLHHEVKLQSCVHLITANPVFADIPTSIVGLMVHKMQPRSYIPGEIVFNVDDPFENLYIISKGTVAIYNKEGVEIGHLLDGKFLALFGYFYKREHYTVITIEYSDIFALTKANLATIRRCLPTFDQRMRRIFDTRLLEINRFLNHSSSSYRAVDDVHQIIEQRQLRYQPND